MPHPEQIRAALVTAIEDHRRLVAHVRELEALVGAPEEVAQRLVELARHLEDHAREEEEGALFAWIHATFVSFRDETEALMAEHAPMVRRLRALAEAVARADAIGPLGGEIRDMMIAVRNHEARESRMVQHIVAEARRATA